MGRRAWVEWAVGQVEADANRSADTHLHVFPLPPEWGIRLYLKDESVHPTGSLKHRLARSLVLYGLCNNWIGEGTTLVEASSGSTAVSEAYFAGLLGLPFVAVMPATTVREKCALIEFYGGRCHLVDDPGSIYAVAAQLAAESGGHYLDQFTYAERATDWRGNNNIAESMFAQLGREPHPVPDWVVVGAGTGGTSATIGRYLRLKKLPTQLCVVDPENSAFYPAWTSGDLSVRATGSRIEGIGRPRVEPSFVPDAGRPDDRGARCGLGGRDAVDHGQARPVGGRLDRHQHVGRAAAGRRDAGRRSAGQCRHPAVRRRAALRPQLLRRRLGGPAGLGPGPAHARCWRSSGPPAAGRRE